MTSSALMYSTARLRDSIAKKGRIIMFLENYLPTPRLSQHFALSEKG